MSKVFVFGSNLAGIHGAGSAAEAVKNHGAKYGQGIGRQGNSYAIPTKDEELKTLPLKVIQNHVDLFGLYAMSHPNDEFFVVKIGCGLAGYKESQMKELFRDFDIENVTLPDGWGRKS